MKGQLFVISAPSGTGKSTILEELRREMPFLGYSVSHTTRKPREGEQEGRDYYFVGRESFKKLADHGAFVPSTGISTEPPLHRSKGNSIEAWTYCWISISRGREP
jgi:guanylate kinase